MWRRAGQHAVVRSRSSRRSCLAAPASAQLTPHCTDPLPGSDFQGADGNQDNATTECIDWQALARRTIASVTTSDPNDEDSAFVGRQ